jgi:uncharacterized spore protein YtfJ
MAVQLRHGNGPPSRDTMAERATIASSWLVRTIKKEDAMEIQDLLAHARDTMTVKQVFGEPYEKDGVTVIPVAAVGGGGGGGSGEQKGEGKGGGGGFGMSARPAGMYVIKGEDVKWIPAFDMNRVIMGGQIVAIIALLTLRTIVKTVARTKEQAAQSE